jgi:hypothetical protein
VAWKIGEQGDDPVKAYLADIFTLPASLAGLPGMSVPAGFGDGGMPVGLQLIGNYFQEGRCCTRRTRCSRPPTSTPGPGRVLTMTASPLIRGYEVVIGLETHAQLSPPARSSAARPPPSAPSPTRRPARSTWRCRARCR